MGSLRRPPGGKKRGRRQRCGENEVGEERWREKEKREADMWGTQADMRGPPPHQRKPAKGGNLPGFKS